MTHDLEPRALFKKIGFSGQIFSLENSGYDNFSDRNARVSELWLHDRINIISIM